MSESEYNKKEKKDERERFYKPGDRNSHIWTGIFILLIGVAALLKVTYAGFPDWIFSWQVLLIALGVFIGLRHRFRGVAWFILIIIGGVFLAIELYPELRFRRYLWPLALIAVGLFFIFRPRRQYWKWNVSNDKDEYIMEGEFTSSGGRTPNSDDFIDVTDIFGGSNKNILSKNFKGGNVVNIFGGSDLNLSQADIKGKAVLEITAIFGGTKLIVPSNWDVRPEVVTVFGGIEDKRQISLASETPEKILVLKGTVIFGGIDIKSF